MKNVIISNPKEFEKKKKMFMEAKDKLHVISDFDGTLTNAFVDGEKIPSIIAQIRDGTYLTKDYAKQAHALYNKFHAIEKNPNLSRGEKIPYMEEWWRAHFKLLIDLELNKKDLKRVVQEGRLRLRGGVTKFLDILHENDIPLIILSATGLGDAIPLFFEKEERNYQNIHIIGNFFNFNKFGNVISVKEPLVHSMNKTEIQLKGLSIYKELLKRKNVLLLGDSLSDLGMIDGFPYDNLIKVGFLNEDIKENLGEYKQNYDVTILDDGDFSFVNNLVGEIVNY